MRLSTFRSLLRAIVLITMTTELYAQKASSPLRSDDEDNKKFLPPAEVVYWGIGAYGGVRGTINTTFRTLNPTYTPTFSIAGESGTSLDVFPQPEFGVTLYVPSLFAEKIGFNLDIGVATYSFGTQTWPRFILSDTARDRYLPYVNRLPSVNGNPVLRSQREIAKFQTTAQFLTVSPMLNIGGFLLGLNVGIPNLPFLNAASTVPIDTTALPIDKAAQTIEANTLQLFIEPRLGLQVPLFSIKNFGTLFFNVNASYNLPVFSSPFALQALQSINTATEKAIKALPLGFTDASFRYPIPPMPGVPSVEANRTRFDTITVRPFSATIGLSFILNFTNKAEQEEFEREERRTDSLRSIANRLRAKQEQLRNTSIALADSAINTIIISAQLSEQIANLEKGILKKELVETKKKVFQAQITKITATREDGTEVDNPTIRVEQFAATLQRPFLPVVYFEQNSSIPPASRYRRIQSAERESFRLPSNPNAELSSVYPHVLNIIGKRMTTSSGKLTIIGQQTRDETDTRLAEKRAEAIATYLMDVWRIPATRLERTTKAPDASNQAEKRSVTFSSDDPSVLAPLTITYTARVASPPVVNLALEISSGVGLKQWELEFQQIVDNQPVVLKEARGGDPYPPRYEWRLNDEPATMPQSSEPVNIRIGAYDINNAAAPDPVLRSIPIQQISLESKRKSGTPDKTINTFESIVGTSLNDMDVCSKTAFEAAKRSITSKSKVTIIVYGGNTNVSSRTVAQALNLDVRNAVLRDVSSSSSLPTRSSSAGTSLTASTPEAEAYKHVIRIIVENPTT
ncbi:MAG: hypothetical protein RML40_11005 [Bacteroidota bacterium]|nr:hypothetical protein [Candidatus Kapabacteria bacterium]MDW8221043.1 hypothetical protein [Bacteroidota bacterium]